MMLHTLLLRNCELSRLLLSHVDDAATSVTQFEVVFCAVVDVLARCSLFPAALSQALVPLSQRTTDWLITDATSDKSKSQLDPLWLRALIRQLDPFTARVTKHGIDRLMSQRKRSVIAASLHLRQLPCGCRPASKQDSTEAGEENPLMDCIYAVISQIVEDLHTLSPSLIIIFRVMQDCLHDNDDVAPLCKSVVLKVLFSFSFFLFTFCINLS